MTVIPPPPRRRPPVPRSTVEWSYLLNAALLVATGLAAAWTT